MAFIPAADPPEGVEANLEHPNVTAQTWDFATQSLCMIFMTIFFALRTYVKLRILNGFGIEDWTCLGAYVLAMGYCVTALIMGSLGGGVHIWEVPKENVIPYNKSVYVTMVMYGPTAFLTKVSILLILTRVFEPFKKAVISIYVFMALMLAYYIPAIIVKIRICMPIAYFWMGDAIEGSCLDQNSIILADAVMSVVSDLILLVLPIPLGWRLQIPTGKKMRVIGILAAGGLACASSIIRLVMIVRESNTTDSTYSFMRINMWGNAEISIGVICACLPAMSALVTIFVREFSSGRGSHSTTHEMGDPKSSKAMGGGHSRSRKSFVELGSQQDILISQSQLESSTETSVRSDIPPHSKCSFEGQGIMKTTDVVHTVGQKC
ncbi:hypothetical protein FQN54_009765 [Arachnomyces sp. PD_36]|nr:hypothetical protein FQN54_009765 [Arachnomyces sp. PD_36]